MTFRSYAQNFEDVLLWRALGHVEEGRYLDIGGQDPVVDSVSLGFYERGWRGTHVEPTPAYAAALREARPDEMVIEAAVSIRPGPIEFFEFPSTGLSTGVAEFAERHHARGFSNRCLLVTTVRLDSLLDRSDALHWLKIDVEGMEADVLASWGDHPARPWVVLVEATAPMQQHRTDDGWCHELTRRGYKAAAFDGLNDYFVHEAHPAVAASLSTPANVFDDFVVTAGHFATRTLAVELAEARASTQAAVARIATAEGERDAGQAAAAAAAGEVRTQAAQFAAEREQLLTTGQAEVAAVRGELDAAAAQSAALKEYAARQEERLAAQEQLVARLDDQLVAERERGDELVRHAGELRAHLADRSAELQRLNNDLTSVERLMPQALAEQSGRWHRLRRQLGLVPADPVRQLLSEWRRARAPAERPNEESPMPVDQQAEGEELAQVESLSELLRLDGRSFVQHAYAAMLGRPSDAEGEAYYLARLEQGYTRLQVLEQLRKSPEARLFPYVPEGTRGALRNLKRLSPLMGRRAAAARIECGVLTRSARPDSSRFLRYHDEEFIRVLFNYFLARDPDPSGQSFYLARLRSGISRQQILLEVIGSPEARAGGRTIRDADKLARRVRLARLPVVGNLLAFARLMGSANDHLQDMRVLQNQIYRLSKDAELN
jgi:FkbM family methyltransferase